MATYTLSYSSAVLPPLWADGTETGGELAPLSILPEQLLHRSSPASGVPALMSAILDDAIACLQKPARNRRAQRLAREAEEWIFAQNEADEAWPFSFVNICSALSLDPDSVRMGLRRQPERQRVAGRPKQVHRRRARMVLRTAQIAA